MVTEMREGHKPTAQNSICEELLVCLAQAFIVHRRWALHCRNSVDLRSLRGRRDMCLIFLPIVNSFTFRCQTSVE